MSQVVQLLETTLLNSFLQMVTALDFPDAPPEARAWLSRTRDLLALLLGAVHPAGSTIILAYTGVSRIVEAYLKSKEDASAKTVFKAVVIAEWFLTLQEKTVLQEIKASSESITTTAARFDPMFDQLEAIIARQAESDVRRREGVAVAHTVKIRSAADTIVPAYLALLEKGYRVSRVDGSEGEKTLQALKNGEEFIAEDQLSLLGLVALFETRGTNWQAKDDEIGSYLSAFPVDGKRDSVD